jgi:hypothetical protein
MLVLQYVFILIAREMAMTKFISSEEYFENSKTRRGSYLKLKPLNFVQIFEVYLVTQSF